MRAPRFSTQLFGSRLARQLFALFVLAALLPLAVSDWLSSTAVNQVAHQLNVHSQERATRQVSRQVLDRLFTAKTLLHALPLTVPQHGASPPGSGRVFAALLLRTEDGKPAWASANAANLWADWQIALPASPPVHPIGEGTSARTTQVLLRVLPDRAGQRPARVLLGAVLNEQLRWIAELNPDFLWSPVRDAMDGGFWQVLDADGVHLYTAGTAQGPLGATSQAMARNGGSTFRTQLFLGGEFGAPDWIFSQYAPPAGVHWLGWPLAGWLGLVAMATLLLIALIAQRQIRRTLVPLEQLTAGTRSLAAGNISTRVAVRRNDEFGALAGAFNDMATKIGAQFHALEGLAAMDRDILAGASVDRVARRVLDQLDSLYPEAGAVVVWQQSDSVFRRAILWHGSKTGTPVFDVRDVACNVTAHEQWSQLRHDQDRASQADGTTDGCLRSLMPPAADWVSLFPLRQGEAVRALIAIGLTAKPAAGQLQAAAELRDRLAVAFAAQDRERALVYQATHDSLTGLINRHGLNEKIDALLAPGHAVPTLALLYVDLDNFKDVNDSHGHAAGDALLRQASERLRTRVQADALVARQGGDEFTIVLPQADAATAQTVAETVIRAMSEPFHLSGGDFQVGASVGIALCPQHARQRDELLRCADIALYAAKAYGRGRAQLFNPALDSEARAVAALLADLRQALAREELIAYYQPRVRTSDGVISSAEALIRWQHPQRGLLTPDVFIPVAESSGLIAPIGHWMINAACQQMAAWRRDGVDVARVSVNVSPVQLVSGELVGQVRTALERSSIPPSTLELEITESLLVDDNQNAFAQLATLRDTGVAIALDDFGTGYSSMAALRKLPIDVMKIDRSFVIDLETDTSALPSVRAIVALAQAAQLHLVAEGVETEVQASMLRELGCHELQGYLYSRPVAPAQFLRLPGLRQGLPAP
ncbi:MAG: EAL domain-containing protein [Thiomonas sp.]